MKTGRNCSKCKIYKEFDKFHKSKNKKFGIESMCKDCSSKIKKVYSLNNKDKRSKSGKKYYELNKERISLKGKLRSEEIKKVKRIYRSKNKDKLNKQKKEYRKNNSNINYKISCNLRSRIWYLLGNKINNNRKDTLELLGCSYEEFKIYLESKFTKNMTWENKGKYGWHIDHIRPCSSFDLSSLEQQKLCFHYSNMQPLWATTEIAISYGESVDYIGNTEKGDKII